MTEAFIPEQEIIEQHGDNRVVAGLYNRQHNDTDRGIAEQVWNQDRAKELGQMNYDQVLAEQIERALQAGRHDITVVDVGSGKHGALLWETANKLSELSATNKLLTANLDFTIKLIGFKDAKNEEDLFTETARSRELQAVIANPQVEAHDYYYSLTATQGVKEFLERLGVSDVDVFLTTWTATYLGPRTFERLLEDMVAAMSEGGKSYISVYGNDPMGMIRTFLGTFMLDMPGSTLDLKAEMYDNPQLFLEQPVNIATALHFFETGALRDALRESIRTPELVNRVYEYLDQLEAFFESKGLMTPEKFAEEIIKATEYCELPLSKRVQVLLKKHSLIRLSPREFMHSLSLEDQSIIISELLRALAAAEMQLSIRLRQKARKDKTEILEKLKTRPNVALTYDSSHIVIEKLPKTI